MTNRLFAVLAAALVALFMGPRSAEAVENFSSQTGQPCTACHIGGFGPQLTPYGRAFKIGGYTQQGGDGLWSKIPLSAIAIGSFNNTSSKLPAGSIPHRYSDNNNVALDAISVFLAGRISDTTGGFVQGTYSGTSNAFLLDLVDLRPYTTIFDIGGSELRIGTTLNNTPTVTDPYNSSFAWGYPFVMSHLAPTPAAQPILVNGFAGNSIGATAYAWYDRRVYIEAGGYQTQSAYLLDHTGNYYGVGRSQGVAPYVRAAYEWDWNGQSAHVGAIFMQAGAYPSTSGRRADASNGANQYTDFAVDGGYQFLGSGDHIFSAYGIYLHETQALKASTAASNLANATALSSSYELNQTRLSASYWFKNTYGATAGWQKTWGPANPVLYSAAPVSGSANSKPNSNAFILEANWVPFGKDDSIGRPWTNLKIGLQYTIYTQFNGASKN
jgi:hypothetical protein